MQTIEMRNPSGFNQVSGKNGGQAWRKGGPGSSRGFVVKEGSQNGHPTHELPRVCQLFYREFIKGYADKVYPMQKLMRNKGKNFEWNEVAQAAFENIKQELCEAPVLGMPTKKGMYVLDTDASVVAISGILHQEQEWNGRTVLRPIAYVSNVCSGHIRDSWRSTAHT